MNTPQSMTDDARRTWREGAGSAIKALVVIDIDQVLAMHRGGDCETGLPIYRTFKRALGPLQSKARNPVDVAIVTHRARAQANCILDAVGLTAWSRLVITANDLLLESIRMMVLERRMEGLSKGLAGGILKRRMGIYDKQRSVMIDNQLPHLVRMIRAGVVRFGLLTPKIICSDAGLVRSFDLQAALNAAVTLASDTSSEMAISRPAVVAGGQLPDQQRVFEWERVTGPTLDDDPQNSLADAPAIFKIPPMNEVWNESDLHTGRTLVQNRLEPVTVLRALKRKVGKVFA